LLKAELFLEEFKKLKCSPNERKLLSAYTRRDIISLCFEFEISILEKKRPIS
jgi:hypothetical protein